MGYRAPERDDDDDDEDTDPELAQLFKLTARHVPRTYWREGD